MNENYYGISFQGNTTIIRLESYADHCADLLRMIIAMRQSIPRTKHCDANLLYVITLIGLNN